jgi:hypothetical protein
VEQLDGKTVDWMEKVSDQQYRGILCAKEVIDDRTALDGWENFYVIVGSSAGALIGLQFVVITLIADMPIARSDAQAGGAFATPSVVHFGVVLLLSASVALHGTGSPLSQFFGA